jgi:soluble lytic murein transglycosylase-like protein
VILNRRIDSLITVRHKEYSSFLLRKRASDLSGIDIPDKFNNAQIKKVFDECAKNELPPRVVFRLIKAESGFRKNAVSSAGAKGFFQIMPATYRGYSKKLGIVKHNDMSNIEVGTFYLKTLHSYFDRRKNLSKSEKWRLTILSYNYGIGRVINNRDKFLGKGFDNYKYLTYILS